MLFQMRKNSVIERMSAADCVRKMTVSSPRQSLSPRYSSTSYLTVGRYLYSSEDLSDMVIALGETNGTSSLDGVISCSIAEKMSFILRSGVTRFTCSARI